MKNMGRAGFEPRTMQTASAGHACVARKGIFYLFNRLGRVRVELTWRETKIFG